MRRYAWIGVGLLLGLSSAVADEPTAVIEVVGNGQAEIDWTAGVISATGVAGPQRGRKGMVFQRRVALLDAYRQLAEAVKGVHVTSETTVEMYELIDDTITAEVNALLSGQQVVGEGWLPDGETYRVTIAVPLRAAEGVSVASIVLPRAAQEADVVKVREKSADGSGLGVRSVDTPDEQPPLPEDFPKEQKGPFTGLVIDCRGFEVAKAMSPKILTADEDEVWGTVQVPPEFVLERGIVGYLPTLAMALDPEKSRAGDNPLVIRCIGREGSFRANAVVSDEDAQRIKDTDAEDQYLKDFKVVFVVDPPKPKGE